MEIRRLWRIGICPRNLFGRQTFPGRIVAPESAVAAEYDRARRPRAREKARAQSRGAPGEEARWDPTEPGSADPRGANRTVHVKTLGGRRVVSRGRSRHGDRALRREGRAPGHRERALRRHGNGRVRRLSKATSERARGTGKRARANPPAREMRKMKRSPYVVPAFSRAKKGWRVGPECAPPRFGTRRGAARTRAAHPARRARGPVPARDGVSPTPPVRAREGGVGNNLGRRRHVRAAARFAGSRVRHFRILFICVPWSSPPRSTKKREPPLTSVPLLPFPSQRRRERRRVLVARARAASVRGRG